MLVAGFPYPTPRFQRLSNAALVSVPSECGRPIDGRCTCMQSGPPIDRRCKGLVCTQAWIDGRAAREPDENKEHGLKCSKVECLR